MDRRHRRLLLGVLGVHLVVATAHGVTHGLVPVWLGPELNAIVAVTTFLGPVAGAVLAVRDHPIGVPLNTLSFAGAFVVGAVLHFVVENPDHVHAIPAGPWQVPFQASAVGVGLTAAAGTLVGAWLWWSRNRESSRNG